MSSCSECTVRDGFNRRIHNSGPVPCATMLVGDAPASDESRCREPFVGPAGRLLDGLLTDIGVSRASVAVSNACLCQPMNNRAPTKPEIRCCSVRLDKTVANVQPKVVVALGASAAYACTGMSTGIGALRGRALPSRWHKDFTPAKTFTKVDDGIPVWVTYHPSYALRNGATPEKRDTVECKMIKADLQRALGGKQAFPYKFKIVQTVEDLDELESGLRKATVLAWDTETSGLDFQNDKLLGLSFSWDSKVGYYLPWRYWKDFHDFTHHRYPRPWWAEERRNRIRAMLADVLTRDGVIRVGQNTSFDQLFVQQTFGIRAMSEFDTMLAHHLINENAHHDLDTMVFEYTELGGYFDDMAAWCAENRSALMKSIIRRRKRFNLPKSTAKSSWKMKGLAPLPILGPYAAGDAVAVLELYNQFVPKLHELGLEWVYNKVIMAVQPILVQSEFRGVQIDEHKMRNLAEKYTIEAENHKRTFLFKAMKDPDPKFNINSPMQLGKVLYDGKREGGLGLRAPKDSRSTDKKTLDALAVKAPVLKDLLEYRTKVKWVQTYLSRIADTAGRIHPHYNLAGTVTGRLACSSPAIQNIPRESNMRQIYTAAPGRTLIEADFSQAEFRVWGALANDANLLADARSGKDIHTEVAAAFFKIPAEKVNKEQRVQAKTTVFGTMYGRGVASIAAQYKTTEEDVQRLLTLFFSRYPQARSWSEQIQLNCVKTGYVENPFGRRRRLPDAQMAATSHEEFGLRSRALRQAVNSPIQSTVSDYTLLTVVRCYKAFRKAKVHDPVLVLEVHDSFVWEIDPDDMKTVARIVVEQSKRGTKRCPNVPWGVDLKVGAVWGTLEPYALE